MPPWRPTTSATVAPGDTARSAVASPPPPDTSTPAPTPPCAPCTSNVAVVTSGGTVQVCTSPVKPKVHVTVLPNCVQLGCAAAGGAVAAAHNTNVPTVAPSTPIARHRAPTGPSIRHHPCPLGGHAPTHALGRTSYTEPWRPATRSQIGDTAASHGASAAAIRSASSPAPRQQSSAIRAATADRNGTLTAPLARRSASAPSNP